MSEIGAPSVKSSELHSQTQLEIYELRSKRERGCEPGRGSTFTIRLPKDCRRSEGSGGRQSRPHRRAGGILLHCMSPEVMLWTAPPPARECHESGGC
jgi:hypothetical protein